MTEHLHELRPPRSTIEILVGVLGKLDNAEFHCPEDRAKRFAALLSLEGKQVLDAIPMPAERAIR